MTFQPYAAPVVVDASVTVASVTGQMDAFEQLHRLGTSGRLMLAPPILWTETANALIRRRRLSAVDAPSLLGSLTRVGIEIADRGLQGLEASVVLADRHGLSVYDATYLWLAIDVDGQIATYDNALIRAAQAEGVDLAFQA